MGIKLEVGLLPKGVELESTPLPQGQEKTGSGQSVLSKGQKAVKLHLLRRKDHSWLMADRKHFEELGILSSYNKDLMAIF